MKTFIETKYVCYMICKYLYNILLLHWKLSRYHKIGSVFKLPD